MRAGAPARGTYLPTSASPVPGRMRALDPPGWGAGESWDGMGPGPPPAWIGGFWAQAKAGFRPQGCSLAPWVQASLLKPTVLVFETRQAGD